VHLPELLIKNLDGLIMLFFKYLFRNKVHILFVLFILIHFTDCIRKDITFTNTLGMKFILIRGGSFRMGALNPTPSEQFGTLEYLKQGDWDEKPVHNVTISYSFYISETEVTNEQYQQFNAEYEGSESYKPYVAGISWHEAQEFCDWLSKKEGKTYRLPTEAEWEYTCRAGTTTLFSSGDSMPSPDTANPWGVKNMHTNVAEWCWDWHDSYPHTDQIDPIGPMVGIAKVIRGGGLDKITDYYARSSNRAGMAPSFPPLSIKKISENRLTATASDDSVSSSARDKPRGFKSRFGYEKFVRDILNNQGNHNIGFRVVQAELPKTEPYIIQPPFIQQCVKENTNIVQVGPDPEKPYFRKRFLLPTPPENTPEMELSNHAILGYHPGILHHHHSPALEVCQNGDLFAVYYTSVSETTPDVAMIATRLRFGSDQWDMPGFFLDFPDANDHAPMLWREDSMLNFFWGSNKLSSGFPFQWISSSDNGATWSTVKFPIFETKVGGHSAQPVTSALRDKNGILYVSSDGVGPESILWVSRNNGKTWIDTGGRSGGRHTAFVLLKDGSILGMGGKSSDINGFMPKSLSQDGGKTWQISKTQFPALGSNQRPTIIRLASGRLFFAGDLQHRNGSQPQGYKDRGSYVALSRDEGQSWIIKKLPGTQEHESERRRKDLRGATLGYAVARQASNGVIHLITSMNEPCLHFAFNEAWILDKSPEYISEVNILENTAKMVKDVKEYKEFYPNGALKARWWAGLGDDGRYLLHGPQKWYYESGEKQWQVEYQLGQKVAGETFWTADGKKLWSCDHNKDGTKMWIKWWPNGNKRSESIWHNKKCNGVARSWDSQGNLVKELVYQDGVYIK
jgi:hypothetical protein